MKKAAKATLLPILCFCSRSPSISLISTYSLNSKPVKTGSRILPTYTYIREEDRRSVLLILTAIPEKDRNVFTTINYTIVGVDTTSKPRKPIISINISLKPDEKIETKLFSKDYSEEELKRLLSMVNELLKELYKNHRELHVLL